MKTTKYIFLILMVAFMAACTESIDFQSDQDDPYAVLVSRPMNDSTVCVHLSYSRFFLDNRPTKPVSDANVVLSVNGIATVGSYSEAAYNMRGGYVFPVSPQPGDSLHVSATIPGYDHEVSASTHIPGLPDIEVLDYVVDTGRGVNNYDREGSYYYNDNFYFKVRFKVKSPQDDAYYAIRVLYGDIRRVTTDQYVWDTSRYEDAYFSVNDPIVNTQDIVDVIDGYDGSFYGDEMLFSNETFRNGEHEFTLIFSLVPTDLIENYSQVPVRLEVRSLSPELYRYIKTTETEVSDFDELFGEPIQVFCNIDGGIGIFGGSSRKRFAMPMPRYATFSHNDGYYFK